jgi:hypothetical protein
MIKKLARKSHRLEGRCKRTAANVAAGKTVREAALPVFAAWVRAQQRYVEEERKFPSTIWLDRPWGPDTSSRSAHIRYGWPGPVPTPAEAALDAAVRAVGYDPFP